MLPVYSVTYVPGCSHRSAQAWRAQFFSGTCLSNTVSNLPGSTAPKSAAGPVPETVTSTLRGEPPLRYLTIVAIHACPLPSRRCVGQTFQNHSISSQRTVSGLDLEVKWRPCWSHPLIAGCDRPQRPMARRPAPGGRRTTRTRGDQPVTTKATAAAASATGTPTHKHQLSTRSLWLEVGKSSPGRESGSRDVSLVSMPG